MAHCDGATPSLRYDTVSIQRVSGAPTCSAQAERSGSGTAVVAHRRSRRADRGEAAAILTHGANLSMSDMISATLIELG